MTGKHESDHDIIPTRLKFKPSLEFDESIKAFIEPITRSKLNERHKKVTLFSKQVIGLHLETNEREAQQDVRYERFIDQSYKHEFNMAEYVRMQDHGKRGIELQFRLSLQSDERRMLIESPLFPLGYDGEVDVYTQIPRGRLVAASAVNFVLAGISSRFGSRADDSGVAPQSLYVTDTEVYHRLPTLAIAHKPTQV